MNGDITRLQNTFALIEADLTAAEATVGPINAKIGSNVDPAVVTQLANQAEAFRVRSGNLAGTLVTMAGSTSTSTEPQP